MFFLFIFLDLAPRTNIKKVQRKAENTQKRAEAREEEKASNPAPMIKDFHQLYEDGEVPRRFIGKLILISRFSSTRSLV